MAPASSRVQYASASLTGTLESPTIAGYHGAKRGRRAALNGTRSILLRLELFDGALELYGEHDTGPAGELVPRWFGPPDGGA